MLIGTRTINLEQIQFQFKKPFIVLPYITRYIYEKTDTLIVTVLREPTLQLHIKRNIT